MSGIEERQLSPRSGRAKIAQRFIAGNLASNSRRKSAKRTTEIDSRETCLAIFLSPVSRALVLMLILVPSTQVLGYFRSVRYADENPVITMTATQNKERKPDEIKVLAEGFHSSINDAFIAVVRDGETYAALQKLAGGLPELDANFFQSYLVVAAFLGQRNTGGYSVEITLPREGVAGLVVTERKPGKGMMVTQMITSPFKLVAVVGGATSSLSLTVDDAWQQRLFPFRISSGHLKMSGGIAGTTREFDLAGELRIIVEGSTLATFVFALRGTDPAKKRALIESATGIVTADGHVTINKMDAGSLVDRPNSGLKATGQFSDSDSKVALNLVSLPTMIADGYSGMGTISAMITKLRPGSR